MNRHKKIYNVFEYSKLNFDEPLSQVQARELNIKCRELKSHTKSDILLPLHNANNQTVGVEARQYVGVVQIDPSFSIQILPKMSASSDKDTACEQSVQNLLFMLNYCGKLLSSHTNTSSLKTFKGDFFEILIYLFATTLIEETRNSLHHEYVSEEQNLPYLRGKLLVKEHILANSITQSRFYLQTDEFTPDNPLNQVFACVTRNLLDSTSHPVNKHLLSQLSLMLNDVTPKVMHLQDAERIHPNRLSKRFTPALELAKLFLSGRSLMLKTDRFASSTFLIDMNVLFEDFVTTMLKKAIGQDTIVHTQGPKQYLIARQAVNKHEKEQPAFMMKPDISLAYRATPNSIHHIIDTKYKILDSEQQKLGVSQTDIYQMYAYAKRYSATHVTLLYPLRNEQSVEERTFITDDGCHINIRMIDLRRDLRSAVLSIQSELLNAIDDSSDRLVHT